MIILLTVHSYASLFVQDFGNPGDEFLHSSVDSGQSGPSAADSGRHDADQCEAAAGNGGQAAARVALEEIG